MLPDPRKSAIATHQRWLGHLQPEGLVVSPIALVDSQVVMDEGSLALTQQRFLDSVDDFEGQPAITDFFRFAREFLGWRDDLLSHFAVSAEVPHGLRIATGDEGEVLEPTAAYRYFKPADPANPWLVLVKLLPSGTALDELPDSKSHRGWVATPHQKFERLLRESGVPLGILCNGHALRLVTAPKGENSGWLTFPVSFLCQMAGRLAAAALDLLLSHKRLVLVPENVRLPALLRKSRDYQAHVSTDLSGQVLEALYELAHGFQAADEKAGGSLLTPVWERDPQELYGGFITTLLRLVFLLYAEDRGLMPAGPLYQRNYSVAGLFEQLRADHERHPDTMDHRFGGWPRLLTLFRAVYGGSRHRQMSLPARQGHLFDPDRFPFLEGRATRLEALPEQLPRVSDGTLHRILHLLLYLDGERLSYRTLDVEQIGSVYETIMGFAVERAPERMIALKPKKAHGAPLHIGLDTLLATKPADREKFLKENADTALPDAAAKALKTASTIDDLLAALDKRIDRRASPHPVAPGSLILQPTDERRRSGSHYTPRSFTQPIVAKTLEPIFQRLGSFPKPADILGLKVADIAVGSAAFLVEACRQLAQALVASWHYHRCLPNIPPDEDEILHAMRLVAQRCLYGVDRNPMAVDLAKLSLWLATLAKDHPFTFLDHSIKCGDSLVGLTRRQIECFSWKTELTTPQFWEQEVRRRVASALEQRKNLLALGDDLTSPELKRQKLDLAEENLNTVRFIGDAAIAAFFATDKDKSRETKRAELAERIAEYLRTGDLKQRPTVEVKALRSGQFPVSPFHWEIEFPEVFDRENPGFDAIVGNPPFLGGKRISTMSGDSYRDWLFDNHKDSSANADLVAHFFRKGFKCLRLHGAFGLIATNTIYQGDTRSTGLGWIRKNEGTIFCAKKRVKWPGDAAVVVSVIWVIKSRLRVGRYELNGKTVNNISAYLLPSETDEKPHVLQSNAGLSHIGSYVMGLGFLFSGDKDGETSSLADMDLLVETNPINKELIFPYISGSDLNESSIFQPRRFVINFGGRDEQQARLWSDLFAIIEKKVKPYRSALKREAYRRRWWQFGERQTALYSALENLPEAFACSLVSTHLAWKLIPTNVVFAHKICVVASKSRALFASLQSQNHEVWTRFASSTLGDALNYSPTDCFQTFPFPPDWDSNSALESAGREYYEHRAALMVRNDEGLTKTYNRFHDPEERSPEIQQLRALHAAMDRAVLDAYGWPDIPTACEFLLDYEEEDEEAETTGKKRQKKKPYRLRWPDEIRDEVLARLLALNAERAAQEKLSSTAPGMKAGKKKKDRKTEEDFQLE
jgi:hypothetical protein